MVATTNNNNEVNNNDEFDPIWQDLKLEKKLTPEGDTIAYNPDNKWTYFQIKPERQKLMHITHGKFHPSGSTGHIWFDDGSFTTILVSKKGSVFTRDFENAVKKKIELLERRDAEKEGRKFHNMSPEEKRNFKLELGVKIQNGSSFLVRYIPPLSKRLENERAPTEKDPDAEPPMSKLFGAKPPDPKAQRANVHWINGKPLSRNALVTKFVAPTEVQGITDDDVPVRLEGLIGTLEPPKQKNLKVAWRCRECEYEFPGHTFTRLTETLFKPKVCPNCEQHHPNLFEEKHLRVNTRVIDLRNVEDTKDSDITTTPVLLIDYPELSMPPNSKKKLPVVHPSGNQMTGQITIGGKVRIAGHTEHLSIDNKQGKQSYSKTMLVAHHAEIENQRSLELTDNDIIGIKRFAGVIPLSYTPSFAEKDPTTGEWKKIKTLDMRSTLLERLCKLVAPHLVFQPNEQIYPETALLAATGAPEKKKLRGRITVLAVGPPGTGKTELMYATMALRPQSKMVSGAGHATGNTATAVVLAEPDGTRKLHIGNVARARFGVCGVNEYDKFPIPERNRITLEVIDKGRIPLEKFGETRDIPAETSIFATVNPRGNVWRDPKQETIHLDEIPLEPIEISRFDIILPYKDIADEKDTFDYSISKNEREERMERLRDEYEPIFLQKYIEYIRRIEPQMTDQANHALAAYYSMLHKKMKRLFDKRHQGSLKRIAKAFARLLMVNIVDEQIADKTQKFLNSTLALFVKNLEILKPAQHVVYEQAAAYLKSRADSGKWTNVTELLQFVITRGEYRIKQWFIHGKDGKPKPLEVKWNWRFREVHDQLAQDSRLERDPESSELRVRWRKDQDDDDGDSLSRGGEENRGGDAPGTPPDVAKSEKTEGSNIELEKETKSIMHENSIEASLDYENFYFSDMRGGFGTSPLGKTSPTQDKAITAVADTSAEPDAEGAFYMTPTEMLHRSCVSCDLEWNQANENQIFQAAFKDHSGRTWVYHLADDQFAGSEVDLIHAILNTLKNYRMVLGYFTHLDKSDWEVLDQRCRFWGIESPVNIFIPPVQLEYEEDEEDNGSKGPRKFISLRMKGHHGQDILDVDVGMLHKKDIVRNFFAQNNIVYNSLELDTVARVRLLRGKFKGVTGANVASQKVELQKAYGKDDAELCYDLATENRDILIAILDELANIVHLSFQKVCNTGPARSWANYYRNVMNIEPAENRVIPKKKKSHADKTYRGGKILPYERLKSYENVTVYDFRQLYPNTAIQNNIAPDVICCSCCKDDPTAKIVTNDRNINAKGYWTCRRRRGSYPQAVLSLTELRAHYEELQAEAVKNNDKEKEIEYGLKQQACKLFANSGYGVYGNRHFEFADVRAAELINYCLWQDKSV